MAKLKTTFFCQNCGSSFAKWQGQCTACKEWNTITEEVIQKTEKVSWKISETKSKKVSKSQKKEWSKELPKYFDMRKNLTGAIIFTDIRNPMRELDVSMFEMLHQRRIPILIVLTKSDKVSQETALETFNELEEVFGYSLCFSIKDKKSIGQLVSSVNELLSS